MSGLGGEDLGEGEDAWERGAEERVGVREDGHVVPRFGCDV